MFCGGWILNCLRRPRLKLHSGLGLASVAVIGVLNPNPGYSSDAVGKFPPPAVGSESQIAADEKHADIREALRELLRTHPALKAQSSRISAAGESVKEVYGEYLPVVTLTGEGGRQHVDSPETRGAAGPTNLSATRSTLTVTENLFSGYRTRENLSAARVGKDIENLRLDALRQELLLEGITAYYAILRQTRLVGLARENEAITKQQLDLEDERVQRGSGIATDVLFAKARLQLAIERRVQLDGALAEAVARYVQVFGDRPDVEKMKRFELSTASLPATLGDAEAASIANNPALKVSDQQVDLAEHRRAAAASPWYPSIDLVGRGNWEEDQDGVEGVRRDWSVMLRFSWELFSGLKTSAQTARAAYEKAAALDSHLVNRRNVSQNLTIAWEQLKTARERVRLLENAVAIAEEVFLSRQRLRGAGRETAINVLDAQNELFVARINSVAAIFDARISAFRVLFAMGLLTPENLEL